MLKQGLIQVQRWRAKRQLLTTLAAGHGVFSIVCPFHAALSPDDRITLAHQLRAWLRQRVATAATPDGIDHCHVFLVVVERTATQRTSLWRQSLPTFTKITAGAALDTAAAAIAAVPLDDYPTATHLEVSLISIGEIAKHGML